MRILLSALLLMSAGAGVAGNEPLADCYGQAENRLDVGPCLDETLARAETELAQIVARTKKQMSELSEVTGRLNPVLAFESAQLEFENFRAINCAWYFEQMSPGTGAGDAQKACQIRLTRSRTRELSKLLPDDGASD